MTLRFAELFAGAGGLSMGLERAGWESVWHAEIAEAPRAILSHHWPSVPLLGDVTTLDGRALTALHGPIALLAGGSPCQDLSVAGKRAGLEGARSGLFYEQMRLWEETGADLCLWENVDGARSSNNGKDFGEVLRAFVGAPVHVPSDGWRNAGVAAGPGGVAAWRVLDAQYFGVPQRRRRVFVLGTRTGSVDPAQVLSLTESLRGDTPEGGEAWERTAASASQSTERTRWVGVYQQDEFVDPSGIVGSLAHASNTHSGNHQPKVFAFNEEVITSPTHRGGVTDERTVGHYPSRSHSDCFSHERATAGIFSTNCQRRCGANADSYGGAPPCVLAFDTLNQDETGDVFHSLRDGHGEGTPVVCATGEVTHALTHEGADASEDGTGRGTPVVVFNETGHEKWTEEGIAGSLNAHEAREAREAHTLIAGTLESRATGGGFPGTDGACAGHVQPTNGVPRRLTPRECERLMGWPDDHTLVPDGKGKPLSDAARYKACGNGVASPVAHWIGERLRLALEAA